MGHLKKKTVFRRKKSHTGGGGGGFPRGNFSHIIPFFSEDGPIQHLKCQVREEGVCSPGFIAGLREKYDSNAREKERQIQREIAKRDFHHSKSEEAVKDVHERITRHLTITEVQS